MINSDKVDLTKIINNNDIIKNKTIGNIKLYKKN